MTQARRAVRLVGALLLAGCGGSNTPADSPDGAGANDGAPTATPVDGDTPAEAALADLKPLSPDAPLNVRLDRARQITDRLRMRSDRVQRWLRDARGAQYGKQSSCLDDMLSQLHAAERDGIEAHKAARAAANREDGRSMDRELSRLMVCEERSRMLVHMARSCGRTRTAAPAQRTVYELRARQPDLPPEPNPT